MVIATPLQSVAQSDNLKPEIKEIHKKLNVKEYVKMKSSLKFCVIATGEYQVYAAAVSYTHLRAHETREDIVCRLLG